ncbi:tetratricopeptide repeat protein [Acidisphaera sp. S103]|uniref:tetratricopeptide repeat protein n=1 Tax=Acidisphaera sp. S103 TaxID=1747223 RepID=UPI00131BAEB1|nr:tetratricopeptide repeat protein [Acidisphaera sp. S103]
MLTDRYGLMVSTASTAARDAYVQGCDLQFTMYPGAMAAMDNAIADDPDFALAYVAKARFQQLRGDIPAARESIAAATALTAGISAREASHVAFFRLLIAGQAEAALAALRTHLETWPRDAMVLSTSATANGLIGSSGRVEQKRELLALLDGLAPSYGDDWWFTGHHAFALAENGQHDPARTKIEHSMAHNPNNGYGAHTRAHLCYEAGELPLGRSFLRSWLATYPRDGAFYSHLSWHLALFDLKDGDADEAFRLYSEIVAPEVNQDPAISTLANAASFLWRWELAGHPSDPARWQGLHAFVRKMFPKAGNAYVDWHAALALAAADDGDALEIRVREMEALARDGRYPSGPVVPALARAFAAFRRRDFAAAIDAIEPVWAQRDRLVGSLAQTDLVEFTLLKAYVEAGRLQDVQRLVSARRTGAVGVTVAGIH